MGVPVSFLQAVLTLLFAVARILRPSNKLTLYLVITITFKSLHIDEMYCTDRVVRETQSKLLKLGVAFPSA
eukprot:6188183-Pleurochrysis_carterae.AAC.1